MHSKISSSPAESASCNSLKNEKVCPLDAYRLRPYQIEIITAVMESVHKHKGITFSVEIARQGGKNEISARLQMALLCLFANENKNLIKCAPTFHPQAMNSMARLADRLTDAGFGPLWKAQHGNTVCLGNARAIFLSADKMANVVGNTAHLLLEVDEAQDVLKEKYTKVYCTQFAKLCGHTFERKLRDCALLTVRFWIEFAELRTLGKNRNQQKVC